MDQFHMAACTASVQMAAAERISAEWTDPAPFQALPSYPFAVMFLLVFLAAQAFAFQSAVRHMASGPLTLAAAGLAYNAAR